MKNPYLALAILLLAPGGPASAEVKSVTEHGFALSRTVLVKQSPEAVYAALGQPQKWWSSRHSWSGDAANMRLALMVGGCFCERLPANKGMVEHGRVIFASPGKQLRLNAALGPLQGEAVSGSLTWTLKPVEGGTEITNTYVVGGYMQAGAKTWAPLVDSVTKEQLDRLKAFIDTGKAP
jgi:uncharacterized protein YndB with AHSA1/START domain